MAFRFFSDSPLQVGPFVLSGEQAHHLANVMRKQVGDRIVLFDGTDREFFAEIRSVSKKKVELEIVGFEICSRELSNDVMVAVALPKGDRQRFLVEKLVELGVREMIPLVAKRCVAEPKPKVVERLRKQVVEASKQCGRNRLMSIRDAMSISSLVEEFHGGDAYRLLAHPYQATPLNAVAEKASGGSTFIVSVGPEGGFTDDEVTQFHDGGWRPVSLGPAILRIETAALCAVSTVREFR